jgi:hypothetical protein
MGELIELSYRYFSPLIIQKLIRSGYLRFSDRHKPEAAMRAWDCYRKIGSGLVSDGDQPS